ncbi:hypothetical protein A3Q56_07896 [Intoshia linei]|uniref:Uncharacterized protein n=1 Tax=Intoshia linei TaxID=1819745 RepID=A0A177AQW4_9BILA|nr:hypothetical protein A3Q56_07896 [Intoshia linei]
MNSMDGSIVDNALDKENKRIARMERTSKKTTIRASGIRLGKIGDSIKFQDLCVLKHYENEEKMKVPRDTVTNKKIIDYGFKESFNRILDKMNSSPFYLTPDIRESWPKTPLAFVIYSNSTELKKEN